MNRKQTFPPKKLIEKINLNGIFYSSNWNILGSQFKRSTNYHVWQVSLYYEKEILLTFILMQVS